MMSPLPTPKPSNSINFARRSIVDRINSVEEKLMNDHNQAVTPLKETVGKIKKAVADTTVKVDMLGGSGGASGEELSSVEASIDFKLEEFRTSVKAQLDRSAADLSDSIELSMESFHNEVENISGEFSKLTGASMSTPLDALLSSAMGWLKSLEDSLRLVEKKQGGIEVSNADPSTRSVTAHNSDAIFSLRLSQLFADQDGKEFYSSLQRLGSSAGSALKEIGNDPPQSLVAQVKANNSQGKAVVKALGSVAVDLFDFLNSAKTKNYESDVLNRLSFKRPPAKMSVKNACVGLEKALQVIEAFLGKASHDPGVVVTNLLSLQRLCKGMASSDLITKMYTPLEYTHNLHDTLSVKIAAAHDEVKNFENTVKTMIAELQDGANGKEHLGKVRTCKSLSQRVCKSATVIDLNTSPPLRLAWLVTALKCHGRS